MFRSILVVLAFSLCAFGVPDTDEKYSEGLIPPSELLSKVKDIFNALTTRNVLVAQLKSALEYIRPMAVALLNNVAQFLKSLKLKGNLHLTSYIEKIFGGEKPRDGTRYTREARDEESTSGIVNAIQTVRERMTKLLKDLLNHFLINKTLSLSLIPEVVRDLLPQIKEIIQFVETYIEEKAHLAGNLLEMVATSGLESNIRAKRSLLSATISSGMYSMIKNTKDLVSNIFGTLYPQAKSYTEDLLDGLNN